MLGAGAKQCDIQCISDLTGQFSLPWMASFGRSLSSKRSAIRRALPWGCPVSHAIESLTEALDKDQLPAANTQLFYCNISSLICLTLDVPWYTPWCAGQLLCSCSHTALTLLCQSLLNQRLVLVLRTALAWAKGISCSYAKGGAFRFWLTNNAAPSNPPFPSHGFLTEVGF